MMDYKNKNKEQLIHEIKNQNELIEELKKKIEQSSLLDEEIRLQNKIMENMAEGVYLIRASDGIIVYTNPKFERLFGYEKDELIGKNVSIVNAPDDVAPEETARIIMEEIAKTEEWHGEVKNIKKDGTIFWCYAKVSVFDHSLYGKVWLSVHSDVTERKLAEQEILKNKANLQTLIDTSTDSIWSVDKDYRIIIVNANMRNDFQKAFGIKLEPGVSAIENVPEPLFSIWNDRYKRVMKGEQFSNVQHYEIEGIPEYIEVSLNPIRVDSKVVGAACFSRDITMLKIAEKEVKESEANLMAQIENTTDSIWSIDKNYRILILNNNFKFGFKQAFNHELKTGDKVIDYLPVPLNSIWKERYDRTLKGEHFKVIDEFKFENLPQFVEISYNPIYIEGKVVGAACFTRDITVQRLSERALKEANVTKDKFLSIIAHDLKSPFNAIIGFCDLLINDYDKYDDEKRKKIIGLLSKSSRNTYALIDNLLTWARSQSGGIKIEKEKLNLRNLVIESIEAYKQNAENKKIEVVNDIPADVYIIADKYTIGTTIGNLFNNAVKFSSNGVINFNVSVNQQNVEFRISDTGVGMTQETISKLFRLDESISTPGTDNEKGTGLGLILCKEFVEKNGGTIRVESEVGNGSTFYFALPK
ncbi:PAS domain S-box protein [Bacteroidota bacterium]